MDKFKQHRRKKIAELREVTELDIAQYKTHGCIIAYSTSDSRVLVSISDVDQLAGSPKLGDMIARNPSNHLDQWLVAEDYYKENFELI